MFVPILKTLAASLLATTSSLAAVNKQQDVEQCVVGQSECPTVDLTEIRLTARRLPTAASGQSATVVSLSSPIQFRVDELLSAVPGVGLFRRANSRTGHPTTQGLTMRGVGANAAGRVLVTLDGVPQNDPFGGWIYWSALDPMDIEQLHVSRGGSAGAFGAQALAGSVEAASGNLRRSGARNHALAEYGDDNSYRLFGSAGARFNETGLRLSASRFETDGDFLLAEDQRGPVDERAASEATTATMRVSHKLGRSEFMLTARYFKEERTNGLSLAENSTEAVDISGAWVMETDTANVEVLAYFKDRQFVNVFASARDGRTTERSVLDQFDVPAWGAGVLARVQFGGFEFGVDGRRMSGETNERFRNLGAGFTRQRRAGGDQWTMGFYGEYAHEAAWGDLSATIRYDRWRTYNGERLETSIEDGPADFSTPLRADDVPDRKGGVWSGRLGADIPLTGAIDLRMAAYKTWRLPTLNEFYRPFRVVNDITEANPELRPETLYGVEIGVDYEPLNTAKASVTYFRNWLNDGVGNVTIGFGPGFFPLGGFVPGGGVLRQRANIDRSVTDGVELDAELELQTGWQLSARYMYARARITRFDARPELVGLRPVQTPRHTATLAARFDPNEKWLFQSELRFASDQFDDDLNTRRLESIVTVNVGARYALMDSLELTAHVENLFDATVVSAVTADGLETLALRRFWRVGLVASF